MNSIEKLTELFLKFPGVGMRQARRFVYFLLSMPSSFLKELASSLLNLSQTVKQCQSCWRFFEENTEEKVCALCANTEDKSLLVIVEKDVDLENIRAGGVFKGGYFVLGGLLSPLSQNSLARMRELSIRIQNEKILQEIIIALGAHPNGDYTAQQLKKILVPHIKEQDITITTLGRGLSTGTEIEYSDSETIKNALESRK
ncbi:recombination protein RecR [bacterium]|nr:recombination protein RecR [bacterium]|tara:strand:+ start:5903 stop:6502 length:600 start_codon:yes stop_codon:yes gene_type:complete